MTEIQRYSPLPELPANTLQVWAEEFMSAATISSQLARTRFVPQSLWVFRERDGGQVFDAEATTAQVTAAIVTGRELGLEPMASLRSIDVINGTPALRAIALRAVLQSHGHDIWVEDATNHRATVTGKRRGSDHEQSITWTMDDAKSRNLAGKPNWRTQPRNMLIARATADVARLIAADALMGIPYTVEELEDGADRITPTGTAVDDSPQPVRKAQRPVRRAIATTPTPAEPPTVAEPPLDDEAPATGHPEQQQTATDDEPPVDDEPEPEPEPEPVKTLPPINGKQRARLHSLTNTLGLDHDERVKLAQKLTERPITTTNELTFAEAQHVISVLEEEIRRRDEPTNEPA